MTKSNMEKFLLLWKKSAAGVQTLLLRPSFRKMGARAAIMTPFRFNNLHCMEFGERVTIHPNCWISVLDDMSDTAGLILEDYVSVGMNSIISVARRVVLEEHVIIAPHVHISDHGHEFQNILIPISVQGIRKIQDVVIGAHSWLGYGVVVLPGASIGRHCVIAANSVVNGPIPDYSVAAGTPARVIKQYNHKSCAWERV